MLIKPRFSLLVLLSGLIASPYISASECEIPDFFINSEPSPKGVVRESSPNEINAISPIQPTGKAVLMHPLENTKAPQFNRTYAEVRGIKPEYLKLYESIELRDINAFKRVLPK